MSDDEFQHAKADDWLVSVGSPRQNLKLCIPGKLSVRLALDAGDLRVRAACGGLGTCGACLIQTVSGEFNPPTLAERQKIPPEDLANGMRLSCQLYARSDAELYLHDPAPQSEWRSLDAGPLFHPQTGDSAITNHVYGVAVDLGTTHIRLSLWNRQSGRRIGTRVSINPQVAWGADVLTRLDADRLSDGDNHAVTQQARKAIIGGIRDILSRDMGEVSPILNAFGKVLIVGNTAMLTLLCGSDAAALYSPDNWEQPIACRPDDADAWRKDWRMAHAEIAIAQPLAGFIGSDLLADLLTTGIAESAAPAMLADFGTNTEIALWDGTQLWVTSVPGGPAFEGVGLGNGLNGAAGAIYRVGKSPDGYCLHTATGARAQGYCGSGFIDAVALLLKAGILKPSGRFTEPVAGGFLLEAGNPASAVTAAAVDAFQRAKASTAAAMAQLLAFAGLSSDDLETLWVCGAFGQHLNLDHAMQLGLLPAMPGAKVRLLANASLAGCEQALLTAGGETLLTRIAGKARVVNLTSAASYDQMFIDHLRLRPMPTGES